MYNIFVSHAWKRSEHYKKVIGWLDESKLEYKNYSVPEEKALSSNTKKELQEALTKQINPASCVIILAGMYAAYSDWIEYEVNEAIRMGKYIIGVCPWGQERVPIIISDNANIMVGWNSNSVISAIEDIQV